MKYLFIFFLTIFSFWLMFHTFSYDSKNHQMLIAAKAMSDFGSHIPHIRSFSQGSNWPPQFPLFPGEPTRYHFLFYAVSGFLEKLGMRIDYALNLPSSLGFLSLCLLIFILASKIFSSLKVGFISVILFLFNGSLSIIDFLSRHPFQDLVRNTTFPSFGPWNGSLITAFWNLNIYTNQRHLGLSFAISLLISYILITQSKKLIYLVGLLLGSLILINQAAFVISAIFITWFFLAQPPLRRPLLFSLIGFAPWALVTYNTMTISPSILFHPGYLISSPLTFFSFFRFWLFNLGLYLLLIPLGLILAPKKARILIFPLLALFILPNLWQFSADMVNNHKFFNFFLILGAMFSANLVVKISRQKLIGFCLALILTLSLTLGGIVDFFPIKNDYFVRINDIKTNPDAAFFATTPKDSIVLNSFWFYHPASIAGRSIYNGYPYFTWSYGYDQVAREKSAIQIFASNTKNQVCPLLLSAGIDYVELSPAHESFIPSSHLWNSEFIPDYINYQTGLKVYSVSKNCSNT